MDAIFVGIDVLKNQLDVRVRGRDDSFAVPRDAEDLARLIERLRPLSPQTIGLEATAGFETFVAAGLARSPACRSAWSMRRKCAPSPTRLAREPRRARSTQRSSRILSMPRPRKSGPCSTLRRGFSLIGSPEGARSWR